MSASCVCRLFLELSWKNGPKLLNFGFQSFYRVQFLIRFQLAGYITAIEFADEELQVAHLQDVNWFPDLAELTFPYSNPTLTLSHLPSLQKYASQIRVLYLPRIGRAWFGGAYLFSSAPL